MGRSVCSSLEGIHPEKLWYWATLSKRRSGEEDSDINDDNKDVVDGSVVKEEEKDENEDGEEGGYWQWVKSNWWSIINATFWLVELPLDYML